MTNHKNLAEALAAFQAEVPTVAKTKRANVGQYAYTYADLADVVEAATPYLTKHGLAFAGSARHVEGGRYEVVGILSHASGESREGALPIPNGNPQQMGSAITYMRRYLFGIMTGIVTDNDDDGALASAQQAQKRERRKAAAQPETPPPEAGPTPLTDKTRKRLFAMFAQKGIGEEQQLAGINYRLGTNYTSRSQLTEDDALAVIDYLRTLPDKEAAS